MSRWKKISIIVVLVIVIAVIAVFGYARYLARKSLPDYTGTVKLEGLSAEVNVYRDKYAVPHFFAKNEADLYRAVGYCMAQERLWQMDLLRRVTTGRLSEVLGGDLVGADELFRTLRIPEKSEMVLKGADKPLIECVKAFSDGVNQYIRKNKDRLPVEFRILGYTPEEWQPIHSVNLIGYMAWDLTAPWSLEIVLDQIRRKVGEERFREIVPTGAAESRIYPGFAKSEVLDGMEDSLLSHSKILSEMGLQVFQASNNWVVSGKKSVTGKPLLANDMHLGLNAPGIWMQMHQSVENGLDVTGVVLPGQPFVVCGHNKDIAWGMTNVEIDNMDFYAEKINPVHKDEYLFRGQWKKMEIRKMKIAVKGGKIVERDMKLTVHGPIVSGLKKIPDMAVSMRWTGNDYSNELRTIYLLNRAKNWDDFRGAVKTFGAVSQNIVYADTKGNIGLYCAAGIAIRKKGNGADILPGWTGEYEWGGYVPFERQPFSFNPPEGYLHSANNKTVSDRYPYYISNWFVAPYRFDRIKEMLTAKEKLSAADFMAMHIDQKSKYGEMIKPDLIAVLDKAAGLDAVEKKALEIFKAWDGVCSGESASAAILEQFTIEFRRNVFADELGEEMFQKFLGDKLLAENALKMIWLNKKSSWYDDVTTKDRKETFGDIALKSYREAVARLETKLGTSPEKWQWKKIHALTLAHPLGGVKVLDILFNLNRGPFPVGGGDHTVSPYSYPYEKPYGANHGASQRHIFDLADWDKSLTVIPTGNSGVPASDYYCDQTALYLAGKYHPDYVSRKLIERDALYKMVLTGK